MSALHLEIKHGIVRIIKLYIEFDTLSVRSWLDLMLLSFVPDLFDLNSEQQLNKSFAQIVVIFKYLAEHEIIGKCEILIFLRIHIILLPALKSNINDHHQSLIKKPDDDQFHV
jgi:hypothetical protein